MQRIAAFAVVAAIVLLLGVTPGHAGPGPAGPGHAAASNREMGEAAADISAQSRNYRVRPRTQLRVYPRYPRRNFHTFYPLPYPVEYPGPNAVRHCDAKLVPEYRPSGTVIVPRTRCWWAPR